MLDELTECMTCEGHAEYNNETDTWDCKNCDKELEQNEVVEYCKPCCSGHWDMDLLTGLTVYVFGMGTGYLFNEYRHRSIDEYKYSTLQLEIKHIQSQLDIVEDINYNLRRERDNEK